jgi:hypothetical protein
MVIRPLIRLALFLAIAAVFLHQRLAPHEKGLGRPMGRIFRGTERVFGPALRFFRAKVPPLQVGPGLAVESSHLILLAILLTALTIV